MTDKKTPRLGVDPLGWMQDSRKETKEPIASKTVKQQTGITVQQQTDKTIKRQAGTDQATAKIKATYYMSPELVKKLKLVGVEKNRDLSDLVAEAVEDLVKKYS